MSCINVDSSARAIRVHSDGSIELEPSECINAGSIELERSEGRTHRAFGGDGDGLQQHLDDAGPDPGSVAAMGVQVVQHLLDHMVGVLCLGRTDGWMDGRTDTHTERERERQNSGFNP